MRRVEPWTSGVSDRQLLLWSAFALVNLASAFAVFRLSDFHTMRVWTSEWLWHGVNLYADPTWATDYPPNAVSLLAVISILPEGMSAWLWAVLNVALAVLASMLAAHAVNPAVSWRSVWLLAATFLCWSATRTLLQFTLIACVFGLASWRMASSRPRLAGVLLGLSLMKPQVALPFVVWTLASRRWRMALFALGTTLLSWTLYCVRVGASPLVTAQQYVSRLSTMYSGPHAQVGVSELARLAPAGREDTWAMVISVSLVVAFAVTIVRASRAPDRAQSGSGLSLLPGALAGGVLVAFRHLSYAFVTLLPASAWLLLVDERRGSGARRLFWGLQVGLVCDVPTFYRAMHAWGWSNRLADQWAPHVDRLLMLGWTVALLTLIWRPLTPTPVPVASRTDGVISGKVARRPAA